MQERHYRLVPADEISDADLSEMEGFGGEGPNLAFRFRFPKINRDLFLIVEANKMCEIFGKVNQFKIPFSNSLRKSRESAE